MSEALYLRDPDDNGVELYWDRPREAWPRTADGKLAMYHPPARSDGAVGGGQHSRRRRPERRPAGRKPLNVPQGRAEAYPVRGLQKNLCGYAPSPGARVDRQRVHLARKLVRQRRVDHAMALEPALSAEGVRHDIEAEMGLTARPVAGMAFVAMRFVLDAQALRRESLAQLFRDDIRASTWSTSLAARCAPVNAAASVICNLSSLEGATTHDRII